MSLAIKYEHLADAVLRLRDTVVLYKGDPVYVTNVQKAPAGEGEGPFRVYIKELPMVVRMRVDRVHLLDGPEQERRKYISSKHFDISPFKMGYLNTKNGAVYCTRVPHRQQKQGLSEESFRGTRNDGAYITFNQFIVEPGVTDMVHGKYPSFDEAVKQAKLNRSCAFHREFSVGVDPDLGMNNLYHKGRKVGVLLDDIRLGNKFNCLKEVIQEMKIPLRVM